MLWVGRFQHIFRLHIIAIGANARRQARKACGHVCGVMVNEIVLSPVFLSFLRTYHVV